MNDHIYFHFIVEIPNDIHFDVTVEPKESFDILPNLVEDFFLNKTESFKDLSIYHYILLTYQKQFSYLRIELKANNQNFNISFQNINIKNTKYFYNINLLDYRNKPSPYTNKLSQYQQFHIFLNYLKKKYQRRNFKSEKNNLIIDSIEMLNKDEIEFDLILALIRECYTTYYIKYILEYMNGKTIIYKHRTNIPSKYYKNIIDNIVGKFKYKYKNLIQNRGVNGNIFDLIALYFYRYSDFSQFKNYFEEHENKKELIELLFNNKKTIGIFKKDTVIYFLKFVKKKDECEKILSLSVNLLTYILVLEEKIEFIKKLFQLFTINNDKNLPRIYPDDDLQLIFNTLIKLENNNKNFIVLTENIMENYLNLFIQNSNLKKIIELYDFIKIKGISNSTIINKYKENINFLYKAYIDRNNRNKLINTLNDKEIIKLYYIFEKEGLSLNITNENELSKKFIISEINDDLINLFKKISFNNIKYLIHQIFRNVKTLNDINILSKLIQ